MNYKFGNKNNWRRWLWNRIAERTPGRANATVLYLAGPEDLDSKEAQRRGFDNRNLIAVENDGASVKRLRASKRNTIQENICDVILAWPTSKPIDVLLLDFCCGLEAKIFDKLQYALLSPALRHSTIAVNMLRGRDPSSSEMRAMVHDRKHRGEIFALHQVGATVSVLGVNNSEVEQVKMYQVLLENLNDAATSYKSKSQVFDSIIYRNPLRGFSSGNFGDLERFCSKFFIRLQGAKAANETKRKISAALAHRTMRMS